MCCWLFRVLLLSEWSLLFPWPFYSYPLLRIESSHSKREVGEHVNPRQNVNESFRMRQKFTIVTGLITESDIENVCFLLNFLLYGCAGLCCYYNILKTSWYAFETPFVQDMTRLTEKGILSNLRLIYLKNAKRNIINNSYDSFWKTWNLTFIDAQKRSC